MVPVFRELPVYAQRYLHSWMFIERKTDLRETTPEITVALHKGISSLEFSQEFHILKE